MPFRQKGQNHRSIYPSFQPWGASGSISGVTLGTLTLDSTFNEIMIRLTFTETVGTEITGAICEYRVFGTGSAFTTLPIKISRPGNMLTGICQGLTHNTNYEVRVTVNGTQAVVGTKRTRLDNIADASTLIATHYVTTTGNDSWDGTSETFVSGIIGPWATIGKAIASAPANAVVQVGPGYFVAMGTGERVSSGRTTALMLKAKFPCRDDAGNVINVGNHTVVLGRHRTSPTGSGDTNAGVWVKQDGLSGRPGPITGPGENGNTPTAYSDIWKWTDLTSGGSAPDPQTGLDLHQMAYATTKAGTPKRLPNWRNDGVNGAQTVARWAEWMHTNKLWQQGGWFLMGQDAYCKIPGDLDPNTMYMSGELGSGIALDGPDCRVSGFVVRACEFGVQYGPTAVRMVVDHNWFQSCRYGTFGWGSAPATIGQDAVEQYNTASDTFHTDDDPLAPAWQWVKENIVLADNDATHTRQGVYNEGTAFHGRGKGSFVVHRYNLIDGCFNGISHGEGTGYNKESGMGLVAHNNTILKVFDDPFEFDFEAINITVRDNIVDRCFTFLSTAPAGGTPMYGPIQSFRNLITRIGSSNVPPNVAGVRKTGSVGFKFANVTTGDPMLHQVVHNTFWTTDAVGTGVQFLSPAGGGSNVPDMFYLRNNFIRTAGNHVFTAPKLTSFGTSWDEDYNVYATDDAIDGIRLSEPTATTYTTIATYRAGLVTKGYPSQASHSNPTGTDLHDTTAMDAMLVNPAGGNYALTGAAQSTLLGTPIPGISDNLGRTPRMGYQP